MHGVRAPRDAALAAEVRLGGDEAEGRGLPRRLRQGAPLAQHVLHLGAIDHARDRHRPAPEDVRQRPQDRARREHRRADQDALARARDAARDQRRELRPAARAEQRADAHRLPLERRIRPLDVEAAALLEVARAVPERLEVLQVGSRDDRALERDDAVLLQRERVLGPVHRARPDALAVDHGVLVVHQRAEPDHRVHVESERVDVLRRRGRARHVVGHLADRLALVVVDHAHAHAAVAQALQRAGDDLPLLVLEVEVVDGDRDVALRRLEEGRQLGGDVRHRLTALLQEAKLELAAHRGAPPVAIAQTSSVESTTCTSARSSCETMPSTASVSRIQSSRPPQYSEP